MQHYPGHLIMGVAALVATLVISGFTVNRFVKRKLKLSVFLLGVYVVLHIVLALQPDVWAAAEEEVRSFERLAFGAGIINLLVISLINPLRADRVPDAFPTILQDAIVIGLLFLVSTFLFNEKLLTTSAVSAVVIGFALQDTLGNAFAGLALQSEKPFRLGHWIRVAEFEGRVAEVTWRATKLRTKNGNFVIVPNNIIAKEAITNYSDPAAPTRLHVEVGASYAAPPSAVKAAMLEAMAQSSRVLTAPSPDVMLMSFDSSSITYRGRFWIEDYERDEAVRDEVRTAIYYVFRRRGIEIPFPIQVQYESPPPAVDPTVERGRREAAVAGVDIFSSLTGEQRSAIADESVTRVYGDGETIVRQGDAGESMYLLCSGKASVVLEPDRQEIATIDKGGYFGEMSLLTGEARAATVIARGDVMVLEIDAELFRRLGAEHQPAIEQIGVAALSRRAEIEEVLAAGRSAAVADAPDTFLSRMKRFLSLR